MKKMTGMAGEASQGRDLVITQGSWRLEADCIIGRDLRSGPLQGADGLWESV